MAYDLFAELEQLLRELAAADVEYALCGGLALAVHGVPRATVDIDLLVLGSSVDAAVLVARACGYEIEAEPMAFADGAIRILRISKIEPDTGDLIPLDLLLVTPAVESVWNDRQKVEWEAGDLWVVSRQGLIELKRIRGSTQDMADIERLAGSSDD